jgi:hypothetical protein
MERGVVISLVGNGDLDREPACASRVDQWQRDGTLGVAGGADFPRDRQAGQRVCGGVDLVAVPPLSPRRVR